MIRDKISLFAPMGIRIFVGLVLVALILVCLNNDFIIAGFRSAVRRNEKLPTVLVQNGRTVYCRMQLCDFRFPVPADGKVTKIDFTRGGPDSVEGVLYLRGVGEKLPDADAYENLLRMSGFQVERTPFQFDARSTHPPGGQVSMEPNTTEVSKIVFSYFGNY